MPSGGYELRQRVNVRKKWWTLCFKLHLVPSLDQGRIDWLGVRFCSTVTMWPPKLSGQEFEWFIRQGGYRTFEERLKEHGYDGAWRTTPDVGQWANFEKELSDLAAVRLEAKLLESLSRVCEEHLAQ